MPEPGDQFGEFVLHREIGRGSMGTVWEARQPSLDRTVALKVLAGATASDPTWVRRFRAEAGAAAKLSHSGILPVYGIGETDGQHWFAMELVDGEDLAQRLTRDGPFPARKAAELVRDAASALQHAHEHGVIHRDVKPANIMTRTDGRVTVTDFGLAKHVGSGALTTTGLLLGTPYYMSPELVNGRSTQQVGPASDVYGLGATLYELLTGRPPFDAPNPMALLKQIGEKDPRPPTSIDPKIPRDLETITLTCLRKRPERRYASAADLARDLDRFLGHQPIATRRPGPLERVGRFVHHNRLAAGVAAIAALLLLGAVLFFTNAMRSQEADYEQRIQELLDHADRLADSGKAQAAEDLYAEAEQVAQTAPDAERHERQARAGRQYVRLLRNGALDSEALPGAAVWRDAPDGRLRLITSPPDAEIRARALRADGLEEEVELPTNGGAVEPGLYRIELRARGRVPSVVNLTAIPGMETTIDVTLPESDASTEGMIAYLGDWRPVPASKSVPGRTPRVSRHGRAFLLDEHSTTNAEYGAFLAARPEADRESLVPASWPDGKPPADALGEPVLGLTPEQGAAYARWRGKRLPRHLEFRTAVVPELVMSVATLPQRAATTPRPDHERAGAEDAPASGEVKRTPEAKGHEEVHLLAIEVAPEAIAGLRALRDALRNGEGRSEGSASTAGPWTWSQGFGTAPRPPGLRAVGELDAGLRLARDLEP